MRAKSGAADPGHWPDPHSQRADWCRSGSRMHVRGRAFSVGCSVRGSYRWTCIQVTGMCKQLTAEGAAVHGRSIVGNAGVSELWHGEPFDANTARAVLLLVVLTALLRVGLAGLIGLSVDESYTVAISRQLALSYFDHPPLHVWLVGTWERLIGSEQ